MHEAAYLVETDANHQAEGGSDAERRTAEPLQPSGGGALLLLAQTRLHADIPEGRRLGRRPLVQQVHGGAERLQGVGTFAAPAEMGFDFGRHWRDAQGDVRQLIVNIPCNS